MSLNGEWERDAACELVDEQHTITLTDAISGKETKMAKPEELTKAENISEAHRWLDKAVDYEADPTKSDKMVELAFKKAMAHENAAFA